ncbi:unnamed protein product [Ectocarpus sp. CCAP 1310/34]|nr:unnamed protein product [Ectocarpus sp. CCAP 1310/34]
MRALTLRQELEEAVPGAFNLSASSLEEVVRAWIEFEPEWAEEAKRRYLNKGTYSTSQAAKKIRRAKGAEMKARVLAVAADEFRAESIELLDGVGITVSGTIIHNVGFFSASRAQIQDAERNRRKRCAASAAAKRRGENVKVEKFRPIDMLHEDEHGQYWSYHLFEYGKNKEGYWTGLRMLDHMSDVRHVGAPSVKRMNLGVGGVRNGEELAPMDPVTILEDTPNLPAGTVQHLVFRRGDDPPFHSPHLKPAQYVGKLKGMRQILWERGLLVKGMSKTRGSGEKQDLSKSMEHVLGEQKDFKEVDSSLVLLMQRHGGACLMLPKYHCECNPIEPVWGRAKDWTRKNCKYSLECLRKNVPLSFRPEKAYKKYKSHRRPTPKEWRPSSRWRILVH